MAGYNTTSLTDMSDRKFLIIMVLFTVASIGLSAALLRMVLVDERVHSDGCSSQRGGAGPKQSLNFSEN